MKKIFVIVFLVFSFAIAFLEIGNNLWINDTDQSFSAKHKRYREITGNVQKGETLSDIFKRYKLNLRDLFRLREASADVYRLRNLSPDQPYKIIVDDSNQITSLIYWIDDDSVLKITRSESGYNAEKTPISYRKEIDRIGGVIKDNLISSIGENRNDVLLALELSDIFAWDIDFTTDIRNGDTFKIIVEGLYLNGELKKYGNILSAELISNGVTYHAYGFEHNGRVDYYDDEGKSLRKRFLKAPLSFRRISSHFSRGRFHPILKVYRPHHGLDYAAPTGTPVSSVGDGIVSFAGRKRQYGNLVIVKHLNGYKTYYGHLSRFAKGIRKGVRLEQGEVVGYVGMSGLATGPHLHYEVRTNDKPINPLSMSVARGQQIPKVLMAEFRQFKNEMEAQLASIAPAVFASTFKR